MNTEFPRTLSLLRQEKGVSQRTAAGELNISQALLSHYENGIREPGLAFVVAACNYYNVSADFLLGRTLSRDGTTIIQPEELYDLSRERDNNLHGSVLAMLSKKLLVNAVGLVFDLLGKTGCRRAIRAAADYLSGAVYAVFRHLYQAQGINNPDFFSVPRRQFDAGIVEADMAASRVELAAALGEHAGERGHFPDMGSDVLAKDYPVLCPSLLQVIHGTGERMRRLTAVRGEN